MQDAGERAYAYTKACGIIGKSFVGKRIAALAGLRSLAEFDRVVFPELRRELPGRELLLDLEARIVQRAVAQILQVVGAYRRPPQFLIRLIRSYEYGDLKTCLQYIAAGIKKPPVTSRLGRFGTVRFDAFPDLSGMLGGTEFEFIPEKYFMFFKRGGGESPPGGRAGSIDLTPVETDLDNRYYQGLKESLYQLSGEDRAVAERILAEEISLRNCIWALRLRTYFKKSADETAKYLMQIRMHASTETLPGDIRESKSLRQGSRPKEISLAAEAMESLALPLDSRPEWHGWRWEHFLNPPKDGMWYADPRYFQNAAAEYLYELAMNCLHQEPMAISTCFCYIKLKQFEEDLLTSIAEGLDMGIDSKEVFELIEVTP